MPFSFAFMDAEKLLSEYDFAKIRGDESTVKSIRDEILRRLSKNEAHHII